MTPTELLAYCKQASADQRASLHRLHALGLMTGANIANAKAAVYDEITNMLDVKGDAQ